MDLGGGAHGGLPALGYGYEEGDEGDAFDDPDLEPAVRLTR